MALRIPRQTALVARALPRRSPLVPCGQVPLRRRTQPSCHLSSYRYFSSSKTARFQSKITKTSCGLYVDRALPPTFSKILIANRGEIACRVIRTAQELGIKTVAVYSDADANSIHVQMADEAYRIGGPPATDSYLKVDKILEIAKRTGAQAIHPGYGFLSENEGFAKACTAAGVKFIGPPPKAIHAMGSKSASKKIMIDAKVPVVPGYHGEDQSVETLKSEAARVGYPIMLKAVLGGGGKGMRIVFKPEDFEESLEACKRESMKSFSDDRVLLERYITRPRHIEFQVFADQHGNAVHLYERDCSVQRRHQKVLEEAPAPGMSDELRAKMGRSACDAALAVGYEGAGTVEFIFDAETGEYFFMEMNTRLQVEHPVTEMIMHRDLVQWQLHVAAGFEIPVKQDELKATGHALEARIYAENPDNNFLPATGTLVHLLPPPPTSDIRVETGVREGDEVSIFYDPMISKLVCWAPDRKQCINRMLKALGDYRVIGPPNNIPFLRRAVAHPAFQKGQVETGFIPQNLQSLLTPKDQKTSQRTVSHNASLILLQLLLEEKLKDKTFAATTTVPNSPWHTSNSFRVNGENTRDLSLWIPPPFLATQDTPPPAKELKVKVKTITPKNPKTKDISAFHFQFEDGTAFDVSGSLADHSSTTTRPRHSLEAKVDDQSYRADVVKSGQQYHVFIGDEQATFALPERKYGGGSDVALGLVSVAPMAGKLVKVFVKPGDEVKKGAPLCIMEAMKMEHTMRAVQDGIVKSVPFQAGDFVEGQKVVISFEEPKSKK